MNTNGDCRKINGVSLRNKVIGNNQIYYSFQSIFMTPLNNLVSLKKDTVRADNAH